MIICPIRLLWLMGLNYFITYHHPSSSYHRNSSTPNTHQRNSSTPNTHHPTPINAIHQHPTPNTQHPTPINHHPTPITHELPRNRRISIQQHTRLRTRRGICLQRRTRDDKGFGRALWSSTYPLPFYSCRRNQRKRFMLPHVGSYPPS